MADTDIVAVVNAAGTGFCLDSWQRSRLSAMAGQRVRIAPVKNTRSLQQNAYWHAEPFLKLAKAWGESVARTKLILMGEFWGWEPCVVDGVPTMLPVKVHTSDMTVEEGVLFTDWLIPWALTDHGVVITLPDEWMEEVA